MRAKKKRVGIMAQVNAGGEMRIAVAIFLAFILFIVMPSAYIDYTLVYHPQNQAINPAYHQLKAAIVDQLSLTLPNKTFIQTTKNILEKAGYAVDYYPSEQVTVEFYRNLPTHDYTLIVLRAHSALRLNLAPMDRPDFSVPEQLDPSVVFFTSERFDPYKYLPEVLTDKLLQVAYNLSGPKLTWPTYFAITSKFIRQDMKGQFQNTTIIMMGCNGLTCTDMARALIQKGAKVYISWDKSISVNHTDQATAYLLKHLITEKQTIGQATDETMKEVGFDPAYKSQLSYYPLEVRDTKIEDIAGT